MNLQDERFPKKVGKTNHNKTFYIFITKLSSTFLLNFEIQPDSIIVIKLGSLDEIKLGEIITFEY